MSNEGVGADPGWECNFQIPTRTQLQPLDIQSSETSIWVSVFYLRNAIGFSPINTLTLTHIEVSELRCRRVEADPGWEFETCIPTRTQLQPFDIKGLKTLLWISGFLGSRLCFLPPPYLPPKRTF